MKKQTYLNHYQVASFIDWMRRHTTADSMTSHGYWRPRGKPVHFRNLVDALNQYGWPYDFVASDGQRYKGSTFAESAQVLEQLQSRLREAVVNADHVAACRAAVDVVRWGRVANGNERWLCENEGHLASLLLRIKLVLEEHDDEADLGTDLRFNAGMTKVYSLLIDNFIIYDSRVAAALAWFVARWAHECQSQCIPELLRFACMPAKESKNPKRRKSRNPGDLFPAVGNRARVHAMWNQRSSWILEELLKTTERKAGALDSSRKLEAALFMWGYDLNPAQSCTD